MTDKPDNPPAFPFTEQGMSSFSGQTVDVVNPGMTLRDYFAAKAMAAIIAHDTRAISADEDAEICYQIADAMLRARQEPTDGR